MQFAVRPAFRYTERMKRGVATFTLDSGTCPAWLFRRMVALSREMIRAIVAEEGPDELVRRLGDPVWFQSFGTVLAFDWNASGLTTILTAAMKEAIRGEEKELGVYICGGKGRTSRKTPEEIIRWADRASLPEGSESGLVYNSRMAAKIDSSLIQDDYQIYHHSFFFTKSGAWSVVQQGMNTKRQSARRYHWHSASVRDLIVEPHSGIVSAVKSARALNLTAHESADVRGLSEEFARGSFRSLMHDLSLIERYHTPCSQMNLFESGDESLRTLSLAHREFTFHPVVFERFSTSPYLKKILWQLCDAKPESYEELVATEGVGPRTVRALSLVAEVIYGAKVSYEDPARYSFAHGGKDNTPYPVDTETYDESIRHVRKYAARIKSGLLGGGQNLAYG